MATINPKVIPMNVQQQGAQNFPTVAAWVDTVHLAANTNTVYDLVGLRTAANLPAGCPLFIVFGADAAYWANFRNAAAAIPAASNTDGSSSEYSPNQRYIDDVAGITQINFIAAQTTNVSMQVYKV